MEKDLKLFPICVPGVFLSLVRCCKGMGRFPDCFLPFFDWIWGRLAVVWAVYEIRRQLPRSKRKWGTMLLVAGRLGCSM